MRGKRLKRVVKRLVDDVRDAKRDAREAKREVRESKRQTRKRRAPEDAKRELLDAAERVFLESQPDQVGLKDIAREAGTSHALITHYFGTYAGLIEATLERRLRTLRESMLEKLRDTRVLAHPEELIEILFRALDDEVHLRLVRWLLSSERPSAAYAFGLQANGIKLVGGQVAAALVEKPTAEVVDKVELAILTAVAAAYGYAIGRYALVGSIGRKASRELDDAVQATLTTMMRAHIRAELAQYQAKT